MTKREEKETLTRLFEVFCVEIFHARTFERGSELRFSYDFSEPRFEELKRRYPIERIAGGGGAFERALALCRWLSPRLSHRGDFSLTETVEMNALSLLGYAFERPDRGINCVAKAKILSECCLALGIAARLVGLYPCSPYDTDNHVVAEIYDPARKSWIMLDPTSGGYFSDGNEPLSVLGMRENFALMKRGSVVLVGQEPSRGLFETNLAWNEYYAKNCYYLSAETKCGFGTGGKEAYLVPLGFDAAARRLQNARYLLETARKEGWPQSAVDSLKRLEKSAETFEPILISRSAWESFDGGAA